ncbi:MAG: PTS fructose transporter subunit IIA [Rhodospirillaceae bacterium]|nr:PTS fructose transporter subunit IIA [Rhodospirillaceae bacterium]|tara:strand:+ start:12446 stop:12853 length:408 start_codon:yes stop_codon:yes gene_type:complete
MIGIVLVTHGRLADEFLGAMIHIVGEQENIEAICIEPDDDMEQRRADILKAVKTVESGDGVILLTDMFGGTPSNLAISVMGEDNVEVVAGVNLPMLIQLARTRLTQSLQDAVSDAEEAGRKYISVASKLLADRKT